MLSNSVIKVAESSLKIILLAVLLISPLIFIQSLYYPYISSKAYFVRLLIELALIPWVVLLIKKPECRPKIKNPLVIALLVFVFVLIITAFTGVDFYRSFFSTIERSDGIIQYIHWVLYFLMAISVFKTKRDWQIVLSVFILTALINCLYGLAHYSQQPQLFGLLGNSSFLGGFLIFAIGFCVLFLVNSFKPFKSGKTPIIFTLSMGGVILLFFIALALTQTRGAYLGAFVGFIVFTVLASFYLWKKSLPDWQAGKKMVIALNAALFIVIAFLILIFIFQNSQFVKNSPLIYRVANVFHTTSVQDRLSEWQTAIKGFMDKPLLGWGPESFDVVANKYYNYRVGLYQPWFDRPHNQALQYLAEGGMVLFAAYLFLISAVLYSIFKIFKREKILASIILAIYIAYIVQGLVFFDALPILLGLFTLLAFIYFQTNSSLALTNSSLVRLKNPFLFYSGIGVLTVLVVILIRFTVFIPFQGNRLIIENLETRINQGYINQSLALDKLFSFKSPYLYAEIRRAVGWDFLSNVISLDTKEQNRSGVISLYEKITPELENWIKYRPVDQQARYVLGAIYRLGFEKLGRTDDLAKAENILRQALNYSSTRIEYIDELGQVLILEKKFDELNSLMQKFASNVDVSDPYRYLSLGHSYFMQGKYNLAMQEYERALSLGQQFWASDRDYYRYLETAQQLKDWQKVVDMTQSYLKNRGEDADNLYNLAVAYYYLGDKQPAREYFNKAAALKSEFEKFRSVFFQ